MEYDDRLRRIIVRSDVETKGDGKKITIQHFDQLGRARLTRKIENIAAEDPTNEQHGIKIQTRYRTSGNYSYQLVSNPYRANYSYNATTEATMGWTRSQSVNTGRHSETETFTGATLPAPWGANANSTGKVRTDIDANTKTVTDQAGKKRKGISDALGRMIQVIEDPTGQNLSTDYVFDALGNLRKTIQGEQSRYFMYDSLGRLLYAKQPEQEANSNLAAIDPVTNNSAWSVKYQYDQSGNIVSTTDARGVTITGTYDALNRLTFRDYSDATADVAFIYDDPAIAFSKGRLTKVLSSVSETRYAQFDVLGRLLAHSQTTDGRTYSTAYKYNLSGAMIEKTYPSGRTVKTDYDQDGDVARIWGTTGANNRLYVNSIHYNPAGAVERLRLGNGKWETAEYNSRLQITKIGLGNSATDTSLLKLEYGYGTSAQNNGSLRSQKIGFNGLAHAFEQTYTYDDLNRLKSATEMVDNSQTWKQTFNYDRYGNRSFDAAQTTTLSRFVSSKITNPQIQTANNRLKKDQDNDAVNDYDYDREGNVILDAENRRFVYDAENRQTALFNSNNNSPTPDATYYYDGEGKRVKKISSTETVIFVYDGGSRLVAEYSSQVTQNPRVSYLTTDHLGSPRIITDAVGSIIARKDFSAFGDETATAQRTQSLGYKPENIRQDYTGYQKNDESGLEFAQARYYNSSHGRFTAVDPLLASDKIGYGKRSTGNIGASGKTPAA